MKTIKFIFSLLVSLVLVLPAMAAPTDGYVYAKDVVTPLGEEFDLPIALKNTENGVKSFQFTITLPDGISFASDADGYKKYLESDYSKWQVTHATETGMPTNTSKVMVWYQNDDTKFIDKGDHVILNLSLVASSNADLSNAKISLSKETVTLADGQETSPLGENESISSSVSEGSFSQACLLEATPIQVASPLGTSTVLNFVSDKNLKGFSFDVSLPTGISFSKANLNAAILNEASYVDYFDVTVNGTTISGASQYPDLLWIASGNGKFITLPLVVKQGIISTPGIHTIELKNIILTDVDGNNYFVTPYTTEVYIGSTTPIATPDANGVVAFHGNYSEASAIALMKASLQSDDIASADLSAVNAIGEIGSLGNNVIINAPEALSTSLASTPNVVINGACANLEITDKKPFRNASAFTATTASYSRAMSSNWGTLCLPFAASSTNANVYRLKNVTTGEGGKMTVEQAESAAVSANIPYIIKKAEGETAISFTASNVTVPVSPTDFSFDTGVTGWYLIGTNQELKATTSTTNSIYFINEDKFWNAEKEITVAPFRAYFTAPAGAGANFRISEDTEGIEEIQTEADNATIYDLQGRTIQTPVAGQIYIRGAKKYIVK